MAPTAVPLESIGPPARALEQQGTAPAPGQETITGAVGRVPVAPGETWRSEPSGAGTVEVRSR
jgi:hypothetical protein